MLVVSQPRSQAPFFLFCLGTEVPRLSAGGTVGRTDQPDETETVHAACRCYALGARYKFISCMLTKVMIAGYSLVYYSMAN